MINPNCIRRLNKKESGGRGPVVYWMSRDQRIHDNRALAFAQILAISEKVPLIILFCLVPNFLDASLREYDFMIKGLKELVEIAEEKNIYFHLVMGEPGVEVPKFVRAFKASSIVTDFDPLKIKIKWKRAVLKSIDVPFYEVDARNIVPCWVASNKQEFGAYTIRPKIWRLFDEYIVPLPKLKKHPYKFAANKPINWQRIQSRLQVDNKVQPVDWIKAGETSALKQLKTFINKKLNHYDEIRNDPNKDATSNLSPYLHFGQISSSRIVTEVIKSKANDNNKKAFIEELMVRRELSDNFCYYNKNYDQIKAAPDWAGKTLAKHKKDRREHLYTVSKFENAETHDELWNAAQIEMMKRGKMHGYMRMYWAKKIYEWTPSAEKALKIAIYLNDKYELDGRDTNGYTGIMWSIAGLHDRAWGERPVFGKIRYMSYNGSKSKFDIKNYIDKWKK